MAIEDIWIDECEPVADQLELVGDQALSVSKLASTSTSRRSLATGGCRAIIVTKIRIDAATGDP